MGHKNPTNKEAVKIIQDLWITDPEAIVSILIEKGLITPDQRTPSYDVEIILEKIKTYLYSINNIRTSEEILTYASGWDDGSWEVVLGKSIDKQTHRDIFKALRILADEADSE